MPHPTYKGSALPVFSVEPNWDSPVKLRTLYRTIISEALDTSEERHGTRPRCLYGLRYQTLTLSGQEAGYIRRVIELSQALPVVMPVWMDKTKLQTQVTAGATTLAVDDTQYGLFSTLHSYALLWRSFNEWEVLEVTGVEANEITLGDAVTQTWPVGTMVIPILIGKLNRGEHRHITDEHGTFGVDFEERFNGLTDQSVAEGLFSLPEIAVSYASCNEEFTFSLTGLEERTVYAVMIAPTQWGPWDTHLNFALQTDEEKESGEKELTINNDYDGECYFAIWKIASPGRAWEVPIYRPVRPAASEIPAPDVEIGSLTEIDTDLSHAEVVAGIYKSNDTYRDRNGYLIPVSIVEDELVIPHKLYVRFSRKYAGKWNTLNSFTDLDDNVALTQLVTVTSDHPGATTKFTRDNSDPTEDTVIRSLDGVVGNAAVQQDSFKGIIRARAFQGSCRSPLCLVAVEKEFREQSYITTHLIGQSTVASCDLPRIVNGVLYASGNPCASDFSEGNKIAAMTNGTSQSGALEPLVYRLNGLTGGNGTYLGWDTFGADYSVGILTGSGDIEWRRQPRWLGIANIHCQPVVQIGYEEPGVGDVPEVARGLNDDVVIVDSWPYNTTPLGGSTSEDTRTMFELLVKSAIVGLLNEYFPPSPPALRFETSSEDNGEGIYRTGDITLKRLGLILSPMRRDKATAYWGPIIAELLLQDPDAPAEETTPEPETTEPLEQDVDNFEAYADGTITTLNAGDGWDGGWMVENVYPEHGSDDIESYTAGAVDDTVVPPIGNEDLYTLYQAGEGWNSYWWIDTVNAVDGDTFEDYDSGELPQRSADEGDGFDGPWELWPEQDGFEDFEAYPDGTLDNDSDDASVIGFLEQWVIDDYV